MDAVLEGFGLHTGAAVRGRLRARPGPVTLISAESEAPVDVLRVVSTARATTVESPDGALRVATVEHLFAALAGLGIYDGVAVEIAGPELPLLDGAASAWCAALDTLA